LPADGGRTAHAGALWRRLRWTEEFACGRGEEGCAREGQGEGDDVGHSVEAVDGGEGGVSLDDGAEPVRAEEADEADEGECCAEDGAASGVVDVWRGEAACEGFGCGEEADTGDEGEREASEARQPEVGERAREGGEDEDADRPAADADEDAEASAGGGAGFGGEGRVI